MLLKKPYTLEICCYHAADVYRAFKGGADRVELCSGYEVGGTTPSLGCLKTAMHLSTIPIYVMIRPRGGNFSYNKSEKQTMLYDAQVAIENGVSGIVFGALNDDQSIDREFCENMKKVCEKTSLTFHRAIDVCSNIPESVRFLDDLGVASILSSGSKEKAVDGLDNLVKMQHHIKKNLNIMPGSGVNAENIVKFAAVGFTSFHSSASEKVIISQHNDYHLPFNNHNANNVLVQVSESKVRMMTATLNQFFKV